MYGKNQDFRKYFSKNRNAYWWKWRICCNWGCGLTNHKGCQNKFADDSRKLSEGENEKSSGKRIYERVVEPNEDHERITRLFGSSKKGNIKRSRLLFSDMVLKNEEELRDAGLQSMTEVKFENSISRATAVANPRQIERAVRGSVFKLDLIYELEEEQEFLEDMETLAEAMKLLQYDYLGGNGSRGYGKIQFQDIYTDAVVGHVDNTLLEKCNSILNEAVKE